MGVDPCFPDSVVAIARSNASIEVGVSTAITLHVSGFFGSFLSGYAADQFGAKPVLETLSLVGTACSLVVGRLSELNAAFVLALV
jgi:hypothetical protein